MEEERSLPLKTKAGRSPGDRSENPSFPIRSGKQ